MNVLNQLKFKVDLFHEYFATSLAIIHCYENKQTNKTDKHTNNYKQSKQKKKKIKQWQKINAATSFLIQQIDL